MKYEVDCVFGRCLDDEDDIARPTNPSDLMRPIKAVYETAALGGGRVVAGYIMRASEIECLYLVTELPDDPVQPEAQSSTPEMD